MFKQWALEASVTQGPRHRAQSPNTTMHWADYQTTAGCWIPCVFWIGTHRNAGGEVPSNAHTHQINKGYSVCADTDMDTHKYTICVTLCSTNILLQCYQHVYTVNNSCIWILCKSKDKPHMYIPVTNLCMQYKHYECTPQEHNSIYTRTCGKDQFIFSIYYTYCTKPISVEWNANNGMIFMGMRSHRCKRVYTCAHTHSLKTIHKYTRGWVDITAIALIKSCVYPLFDCMDREKKHTSGKTVMKSLARLLQTYCPEYKFPMQVFVFIHQYSLCEWMYHWSVAIDPVLNLIVILLFSSEPGEEKKKGDQMSWWQHVALSKVALSIKIDRKREGRYFSRTPTIWHFRKAVLCILSPSIVAHKEHRCLDWGNLSYGLTPSRDSEQVQM